jgi:hypothetical protein
VSSLLVDLDGAVVHLELDGLPVALRRRVVRKRDRYEHAFRDIVKAGVRTGEFVDCDVTLVVRAILGALNWTARWYRPDGPRAPTDVAKVYARYLTRGLAA